LGNAHRTSENNPLIGRAAEIAVRVANVSLPSMLGQFCTQRTVRNQSSLYRRANKDPDLLKTESRKEETDALVFERHSGMAS